VPDSFPNSCDHISLVNFCLVYSLSLPTYPSTPSPHH
jgi:hypothetical protein